MHVLEPAWEAIRRDFEAGCAKAGDSARSELVSQLNGITRRLRQFDSEYEWASGVIEGASYFVAQIALFEIKDTAAHLRAQRNLNLPEPLSIPLSAAGAFLGVIESKEPVIALRTPAEVSDALTVSGKMDRVLIVPIHNGVRVAALLFAASGRDTDLHGLELVGGLAGLALNRPSTAPPNAQLVAISTQGEKSAAAAPKKNDATESNRQDPPAWADLSESQRELHIRAQRFARVAVAEMQLYRPEASQAGREQGNLYVFLKKEIDKARENYRTRFMTIPSMVDYLHLELVRVAAGGDELKLGADYPGQLD